MRQLAHQPKLNRGHLLMHAQLLLFVAARLKVDLAYYQADLQGQLALNAFLHDLNAPLY